MPALYCNVSGLHLIPQRRRRLWVIAAGIYWQCLVGASALLVWFAATPGTLLASLAMILVLGSLLDVIFNANPFIKLDGYYFLSQRLRIPNLKDRSRACWAALFWNAEAPRCDARERRTLLVFGFCSFLYNLALPTAIVWYAAQYLMDWVQLPGLLLRLGLGVLYAWRPLKKILLRKEMNMIANKRWTIPAAICAVFVGALCLPWNASVGSYGTQVTIPGQEAIVHAPENGSLIALEVQPGQRIARNGAIGRMGNLDLEEQIAQVRSDLARVQADDDRLMGELRVQEETSTTVEWQFGATPPRVHRSESEERQIQSGLSTSASVFVQASTALAPRGLPAALAVLQADTEQLRARAAEASRQASRARALFKEGILARSDPDAAEAKSAASAADLEAARERLNAALLEHRRKGDATETEMNVARGNVAAGRAQAASLNLQIEAAHRLRASLEDRLRLLEHKRAQFVLTAPFDGTIFGEDLPHAIGQYFLKGAEICRVANTHELLVWVQMAEQSSGDVTIGQGVRVKTRAFPDRVFHGVVSKIGGKSELDSNSQRSYRVEQTIQNPDGLLRPGMTVYTRIDFGRHMVAWLSAHKLKQALRPEMWML
jgi:hypothetical protein